MIDHEDELRRFVGRVVDQYRRQVGFFGQHRLPEYEALDRVEGSDRDRALFLTLAIVPYHLRPSGEPKPVVGRSGLWQVCANLWQQHDWTFDPERLLDGREDELSGLFGRLQVMDAYDDAWWIRTARTLRDEYDSDPLRMVEEGEAVAPWVERIVRREECPGLADAVNTPLWLRMIHDEVCELAWLSEVEIPADPVVVDATAALGDLDLDPTDEDHQRLVRDFWGVFGEKHGLAPLDIDRPLRLLGLYWAQGGRAHAETVLAAIRD